RVHPFKMVAFENALNEGKKNTFIKKRKLEFDSSQNIKKESVQTTIDNYGTDHNKYSKANQKNLDELIIKFVISETQPLTIVDKPSFVSLVQLGLPKDLKVMCRKTLKLRINNMYLTMIDNIISTLGNVMYVATTADCWSKGKRGYLGVTCHWINSNSLQRHSVSLACSHENEDVEIINLFDILENITHEQEDSFIQLPPHFRCASHTLDLIAKNDIDKMVQSSDTTFKNCYRKALGKCSSLWTKQNMSNIVAEKIHDTLEVYLKTPNKTRWNCTYDSLLQIQNILIGSNGHNKMNNIMDFCEIQRFTNQEIQLIQEYCEVMTPLAESLDFLQGEESMFMGYLLPTLYALDKKLIILQQKTMKFCGPLIKTVRTSIQTRFSSIWEKKELILASCLLPRFKLLWLDGDKRFMAKSWLRSHFEHLDYTANSEANETESPSCTAGTDTFKEDFFCLPVDNNSKTSSSIEELELYLKSQSKELSVLLLYPTVLTAFLKFNTPLPSSAPVERLFSTGSNVMTQKRHKLSDSLFEKLVLLKQNK
ncbi:Uncharacterized protein FWK35_00037648, partial [Aphis craccivora]